MSYQIKIPSCIFGGAGSIENVKAVIEKENAKKVIIFTDKGIRSTGLLDLLTDILEENKTEYQVFDDLACEPSYQDVEKVMKEVENTSGDLIIAIGGGSVMDAAKLCCVLKDADYTIKDLLNDPMLAKKQIKTVMIPTTCGTGSEATCNAIVAVPEEQSKKGIVNDSMIPDYVVLDSNMIRKLPKSIVAATGVDALAHVVECFTSKKATPFSDTYAAAGAKLIFHNIREAIRSTGLLDLLTDILEENKTEYQVFDDLACEPSYQDVEKVMKEVENTSGDLIIAIGGGSVMDAAKLCCVLKDADYTIKDLLNDPMLAKKQIKTVMIPTTCGTGSEATCNAIVAVPEEQSKKGIVNDSMIPDYVVLDSNMIRKLPKSIVAATGVDALAHVVECFTSKKATPFSDTYAAAGAKLIFHNIREAYNNPDNMEAKSNMMTGAFYGGVAITGSGTTAVHALSYPLGGKYHIAHGVSNAILFAHVMEFNKDACSKRLAILCDAVYPELAGKSEDEKAQYMIDQIADIVKVTNIPTDLKEFGVKPEDLDFLVDAGSKQQRLLVNNMKELSLDDIRNIYLKVLK